MAWEGGHGIPAGADLSAKQFYCCVLDTSMDAQLSDATSAGAIGVLANRPESGEGCKFYRPGEVGQVYAGDSTIQIGEGIASNASGQGILCDSDTLISFGMALATAGASGEIIPFIACTPRTTDIDKVYL